MNTAYVHRPLFHELGRHGDNPSLHVTAYLSLEESPNNIGIPLRIICTTNVTDNDDNTMVGNDDIATIHLHPLLLRVLLRLGKQSCVDSRTNAKKVLSNIHQVQLSSWYDVDGLASSNCTTNGWLEHIDMKQDDETIDTAPNKDITIHLVYICSHSSRDRDFFSSGHGKDLLLNLLVGEVVVEGGILAIDIGKNDYNEQSQEEVVFCMVDKIVMKDGSAVDTKFLHLGSNKSFDISFDTADTGNSRPQYDLQSRSNNNMDSFHYSCPGYEPVLSELLTLANMDNRDGAPTAVILSGCAGVGKSRMATWLEQELSPIHVSCVSAKDILLDEASSSFDQSSLLGETNGNQSSSNNNERRLLIIDDLDAIIGNADETDSSSATISSNIESEQLRALNAIVKLVDSAVNDVSSRYFVLGISRASWSQFPVQLARVGRFEKVVSMPSPTLGQRRDIFKFWLSTLPLLEGAMAKDSIVTQWSDLLAPRTAGCVAADIRRICADALACAATRVPRTEMTTSYNIDETAVVRWEDIKEAARTCVPSQLASMDVIPASSADYLSCNNQIIDARQEFDMAWKEFGGYSDEKKRLYRTVVRPWRYHIMETANNDVTQSSSSIEATLGMSKPSGVLFHGPPGVGKTFAAMCLASSLGLHCVKVRASEVFNQWLGGSEATLRSIFARARSASPCILFFDELDSLATNRGGGDSDVTSGVQSRILTTLLNEMDGITNAGGKQDVLVVAATNRLDSIDAALLRPGRLEEHVLLPFPDSLSIQEILKLQTASMPIDDSVDMIKLSDKLEVSKASCAEIEGICRDACLIAMRRCSEEGVRLDSLSVLGIDFEKAFCRIKRNTPS